MTITNESFESQKAPCGRLEDGMRHLDRDDECRVTDDLVYACGCRVTRHEYHDGSLSRKGIRVNGVVSPEVQPQKGRYGFFRPLGEPIRYVDENIHLRTVFMAREQYGNFLSRSLPTEGIRVR